MAINRKEIKKVFETYTSNYDINDIKVKLKVDHTYRVASLCDKIAKSLNMNASDCDFAWMSGILHDIGRFEQLRRFSTFQDKDSVNHAALSADLLFNENLICEFTDEDEIDYSCMEKVIRYHNVLALPENQEEREHTFCDILRDADKIDILRVNCKTPRTEIYDLSEEEFAYSSITDAVFEDIISGRSVDRRNSRTGIDFILGHIAFVYGLNFEESVREVKRQGYLQKLLDFKSENPDTAEKMRQISVKINKYLKDNI